MDNSLLVQYLECAIVIGLTITFFNLVSRKHKKVGHLILFVLFPVWVIIALVKGFDYYLLANQFKFTPRAFTMLLAETFPMTILFGGISFWIKYRKLKKSS